ncbi:hypothetical protein A2774_00825 [Candidatus Roizmanbacteria bacterium RIFCSPHIGHO2_01_FULL_39_12c]|uniref:NAD(P)-binding domain-containing protein n=1 Tax=Candidatus Roizmanbacteria bacterium RIFCSPHIGHO2_01_FULL_39_12c TaxID=1802031 RepID=A0A1F7GF18_9BACT|nr:MAG: hypothetical protein A2774_00825 [Candidatus Roizmanbacteria bacterium RIFCSPHIGHO2_01_FULL_39_12c]OGK46535.1 MAG: hypothetical protein A2963_02240 [Candidatus Roizmanbacteria bacterium RIFCSPLOWO2_01_FULL_40_13]
MKSYSTNLKSKNILVTGGTGFVGSHLVEELVRLEANVVTTFISTSPLSYFFSQGLNKKVKMVHADVADFESMTDIVTKFETDFIFHLAAQALVETAYYNPRKTLESNITGTINILEAARLYPKVTGVIVASSDKAYGKIKSKVKSQKSKLRYQESDPLRGDHPYEVSKSAADLISTAYYRTYNLPVVITRFGNIYGEGDLNFSRIVPGIIESVVQSKKLEVRSNGSYVRDYLYVKDVVSGYLLLADNIDKAQGEAFNFGSEESLSVIEVINRFEKILHKKIDFKILNSAKNEIPYQSLDYSKIKKVLGWKPKFNLMTVGKNIYFWYKKIIKSQISSEK